MLGWDTSVMLVERVEVIFGLCVSFSSDDKRHSSLLINFIIINQIELLIEKEQLAALNKEI